jgi:hydrogenase maturation protease
MTDLRKNIGICGEGRVCLMGLGNPECGDDGLGVCLAQELALLGVPDVVVAGTEPDRFMGRVAEGGFDHLILMDAVDFGGAPGSAIWLDRRALASRWPQVSTHRVSLGLLARWVESAGRTRAWLLGVQPQSLKPAGALSPVVRATLDVLRDWLREACAARAKP